MEPILSSYKRVVAVAIALSTLAQWMGLELVAPVVESLLADATPLHALVVKRVLFIISSTTLYTSLCALALWLFERYGWKRLHPELDFEGTWSTEYTYDPPANQSAPPSKAKDVHPGTARVYQAWEGTVSVVGTFMAKDEGGESVAEWESKSFVVATRPNRTASITMSYVSKRSGDAKRLKGGEQVLGVEELAVVYDSKRRPIQLLGTFYNYIQKPTRKSGHATWIRQNRNPKE